MSAVLLAVFDDYDAADRVRSALVLDGFPTDRVELTACCEPGRAALEPGNSLHDRLAQYFRTLFARTEGQQKADMLAERVEHGAATVTVHPRGSIEIQRAVLIMQQAAPADVAAHDLESMPFEHAASREDSPWIRHFWVELEGEQLGEPDCIFCKLFERGPAH